MRERAHFSVLQACMNWFFCIRKGGVREGSRLCANLLLCSVVVLVGVAIIEVNGDHSLHVSVA